MRAYYLGLLAEALGAAGDKEGALNAISNALSMAETSGERLWEAELCRLHGELLLLCQEEKDSEGWFQRSLDVSRRQRRNRLRYAPRLAWRGSGAIRESRMRLAICSHRSTAGSPKDSTRAI
jgi:predicted ATPase